MRLIVDAGNTAVKLGLAHDGGVWIHGRFAAEPELLDGFVRSHGGAIDEALLLSGGRTREMAEAWLSTLRIPVKRLGIDIALPDCGGYHGMGMDRMVAGLVAVAQERRDLLVIDSGTAVTLGAWRCREGRAWFAGGLILPGAWACALGLVAAAPALPPIPPRPGPAAAFTTADAIAVALHRGHPAMVAACLADLRHETGFAHLLVTGGGAPALIEAGVVPALANRPGLVLEGIEHVASNASKQRLDPASRPL